MVLNNIWLVWKHFDYETCCSLLVSGFIIFWTCLCVAGLLIFWADLLGFLIVVVIVVVVVGQS